MSNNQTATAAATADYIPPYPPLVDTHGRTFDYMRVAVTEKCNLRCTYCMPEEGVDFMGKDTLLTTDEFLRIIKAVAQMGIRKVRFTGGEPLVRKDIVRMVEETAATPGIKIIKMTTNALLLPRYVHRLKEAGLTGLNISLDTLNEEKFLRITRRKGLKETLDAIDEAVEVGIPSVKINLVAMRGFNDDELLDFCEYTKDHPVTVRFIEFMPFDYEQMWETGGNFLSAEQMCNMIKEAYPNIEDSSGTRTEHHMFKIPGYAGKVGVIPAFTRSLCVNCSRIRLTSDGNIRNCLYSDKEFGLRDMIREGCSDEDIMEKFREAFQQKAKDGFIAKKESEEKPVDISALTKKGDDSTLHVRKSMTQIGG
ncbi:MAG: GTP 3',8-cyclase MoaA [Gammaproteobacteria bacterium]|nr:MAG: GTP 3',8-cyclase MoaA [Gammaproteobacteria bacterium]